MKMNVFGRNYKAQKEALELFLQRLIELQVSYERMRIETTYGDTRVVITGEKENLPLVLLYGLGSGSLFAGDTTLNLVNNFRIYAVDMSVQPNLSDESGLSMNDYSYGKWMYEILSRLEVRNVFLTGISLGGFVALKTLAFDETKIAKAFLINPAGIVSGSVLENLPAIPLISKEEAERIKTPIHIFAAENDVLFPGKKLIRRAQKIFSTLSVAILLKKSKHVSGVQENRVISEFIRKATGKT